MHSDVNERLVGAVMTMLAGATVAATIVMTTGAASSSRSTAADSGGALPVLVEGHVR